MPFIYFVKKLVQWIVRSSASSLHRLDVQLVLLALNACGVLFGFAWYKGQMTRSLPYLMPFIPDSPVSALFLVAALVLLSTKRITNRILPYLAALAMTWLIQYGLWGVAVLTWELWVAGMLPGEGYALLFIHLGMVIEGVTFSELLPEFTFSRKHVAVACATLYIHDYVDYVFNTFPFLPRQSMLPAVSLFTPLLTTLIFFYVWQRSVSWNRFLFVKVRSISVRTLLPRRRARR